MFTGRRTSSTKAADAPPTTPRAGKGGAVDDDMWKMFSALSAPAPETKKEKKESEKEEATASSKPRLPDFVPSKYSRDEAVLIIQKAIRGYLAVKRYNKRAKDQRTRVNIAREMMETEKAYVNTLQCIVYNLLLPLRALSSQGRSFISDEDIKTLFSSVEVILGFSTHLLQRLTDRFEEWKSLPPAKQLLSDVFLEMTSYTKVYISYVSNYEAAGALCTQLRKKNEAFAKWEQEALGTIPGGHKFMGFLLITPVQRIPRYLLLVEQLLKVTWPDHKDVKPLSEALVSIKEIAILVDKRTEEAERLQRISEIEESISGKFESLREPNRRFIMEGELEVVTEGKQSGKFVKSVRYFFLFNDLLVVCKYAKVGSLRGSLKGSLKGKSKSKVLFDYKSRARLATDEKVGTVNEKVEIEGIANCFELILPSAKFTLCASSESIKIKWTENLIIVLKDLEPKIQFKQDVANKMATEKAKRARDLIHQQYVHLRVENMREGESGGEESSGPSEEAPTTRRFRAHRDQMSGMKKFEQASKAEEVTRALEEEEKQILTQREKDKDQKELERRQALEQMKSRYQRSVSVSGPGDKEDGKDEVESILVEENTDTDPKSDFSRRKKKKRVLALDESSAIQSEPNISIPKSQSLNLLSETPPMDAPKKRAFRRLAEETTPRTSQPS